MAIGPRTSQARSLRSDRALAKLGSDRARTRPGRYVATELSDRARTRLGRYVPEPGM
ncbi:hypothetical protein DY000_02049948 [Brassica cretica]|uniref:Uncharacterized protein n=1 Tax=Brassica cretica TaxID=69181 RepID=A0ABQ7F1K4_BRACR|nr:hypothetical protein DY000_02049948 [Brassica cretica]